MCQLSIARYKESLVRFMDESRFSIIEIFEDDVYFQYTTRECDLFNIFYANFT